MDLRTRLGRWSRLSADEGSLTAEAALSIGAVIATFSLLVQAQVAGSTWLRLQSVAVEASNIAATSGSLSERLYEATQWSKAQLPEVEVMADGDDGQVVVQLRQELILLGGAWRPTITANASAPRLDTVAWQL